MKFFDRAWASSLLTDEEVEAVIEAYQQHTERLLPSLPPDLARLAGELSLHDGLIRQIVIDRPADSLTLKLRCGNQQTGYFDLDILYEGVVWKYLELDVLANRARDRRTELIDVEFHQRDDGLYEHCMRFSPSDDTCIRFKDARISVVPRDDRRIHLGFDPFLMREDLG